MIFKDILRSKNSISMLRVGPRKPEKSFAKDFWDGTVGWFSMCTNNKEAFG